MKDILYPSLSSSRQKIRFSGDRQYLSTALVSKGFCLPEEASSLIWCISVWILGEKYSIGSALLRNLNMDFPLSQHLGADQFSLHKVTQGIPWQCVNSAFNNRFKEHSWRADNKSYFPKLGLAYSIASLSPMGVAQFSGGLLTQLPGRDLNLKYLGSQQFIASAKIQQIILLIILEQIHNNILWRIYSSVCGNIFACCMTFIRYWSVKCRNTFINSSC